MVNLTQTKAIQRSKENPMGLKDIEMNNAKVENRIKQKTNKNTIVNNS